MICHRIGEANLYFNMYLNYRQDHYLIRAMKVNYHHTVLLCIEARIYFEAMRIWNEDKTQYKIQQRLIA